MKTIAFVSWQIVDDDASPVNIAPLTCTEALLFVTQLRNLGSRNGS